MLRDVFGLIYASEDNPDLRDLVMYRSVAALPVGGRYRAIDFILSNMVNSGITNIGVITQKNYKSLMDHVGSGKEWGLSRKNGGLFILPPFDTVSSTHFYLGVCDAILSKIDYLHRAPQQYCLLSGSYTVHSALYETMMKTHVDNRADITMLYSEEPLDFPNQGQRRDVRILTDGSGRVAQLEVGGNQLRSEKLGMEVFLISKSLLEYLVQGACSRGVYRFVADAIMPNLPQLRVFAVPHEGKAHRLQSISSYFDLNMSMINESTRRDLFRAGQPVYTKIKDEAPVRYREKAQVRRSILGDGCDIAGSLESCVLFRGVDVGRGTTIKNSIIMQGTEISDDCYLENAIIDKYVSIRRGVKLIGAPEFPVIIRKGAVV